MFSLKSIRERTLIGMEDMSKEKMSLTKYKIQCAADRGERNIVVSASSVDERVLDYLAELGFAINKAYVSKGRLVIDENGIPDEEIDIRYTISW